MRVVRCSVGGQPRYGVVDGDRIRVLDRSPFGTADAVATGDTLSLADAELLAPTEPHTIYAIGRNYAAHAEEMGLATSTTPTVFLKPRASLLAPGGTVVLPPTNVSSQVQHEAELAVVIGRTARHVTERDALSYVAGYTCANDVTARDIQRSDTNPTRAKGFDTFCPLGPWVQTELDASAVPVRCRVNGELRQDGNTADLIFSLPFLVSWLSTWSTLRPGDVILTGSPQGTGPLRHGDTVEIEVGGVGTLTHSVAASA